MAKNLDPISRIAKDNGLSEEEVRLVQTSDDCKTSCTCSSPNEVAGECYSKVGVTQLFGIAYDIING